MSEIFDKTPFAYVGENTHYKELTQEEKEELKEMKNRIDIKKEANPSSEEIKESSASVVGEMLLQVGLTETEEPNVDDIFADADEDAELLREALNDAVAGADLYFETAGFIEKLKDKFKKNDKNKPVNYDKVMKASKSYTSLRMAGARLRIAVTEDPKVKNTSKYRELQRKVIKAEKEYRKLKNGLTKEEVTALNQYIEGFETTFNAKVDAQIKDIKDAKKVAIKKEYAEDNNIIREFSEYLGNDVVEFLTESSSNIYYEGANLEIHKKYREDLKDFKKYSKQAREYIKDHKYDSARKELKDAIKVVEERKKHMLDEIESIDDDNILTAICGFIFRDITILCRDILLILFLYPVAVVREWIDVIKDIVNAATSINKKGYFSMSDLNRYTNFVKNDYDRMIRVLEKILKKIDDLEKEYEKEKEENVKESADDVVLEKGIDADMKPILDKLHAKGYKTSSSSSGHNNLVKKGDRNDNGVLDEYLYNDARLVFKGKYNLGKAPQYWYWKKVDNADEVEYLDIEQTKYKTQPGGPSNAFQDWKRKYMKSLENWVDKLPNISDKKEDVKSESVEDINKQIDTLYESVISDLMLDIEDL